MEELRALPRGLAAGFWGKVQAGGVAACFGLLRDVFILQGNYAMARFPAKWEPPYLFSCSQLSMLVALRLLL